jgi:hypothetical protein
MRTLYGAWRTPPPLPMLEAELNSAYANKDAKQTLENSILIIKNYPEKADIARLMSANISLFQGNYELADSLLTEVRKNHPDSPGPMISLGLANQLMGRFEKAEKNYAEFCYLFDIVFPDLVEEINRYRYLMQEGFRTPPKWQEMYRYQIMHEL